MSRILVKISVNLWERGVPEVEVTPLVRETEKALMVAREHTVRNRTGTVRKVGPMNKSRLGRISSPRPGVKHVLLLLDEGAEIRATEEYRDAVIRMMDQVYGELAVAGANLETMEGTLEEVNECV